MPETYSIYTDGSCIGNPGPGGWAYLLLNSELEEIHFANGGETSTTNNRMEMLALIKALEYLDSQKSKYNSAEFNIFSDSNLLVQTINSGWKKKANLDLWLQIDQLLPKFNFKMNWVKAHHLNVYNNRVDQLAREAAELFSG